jgi:hypothetical protein
MTFEKKLILTINSSIKECDSHLSRLRRSYGLIAGFFPLTEGILKNCSEERIGYLDQFIYRFTKLQDAMGSRLLPSVYSYLKNEIKPVPFIDILSGLEKYEVLTSENDWQFFRNLRNFLTHDYPESIDQTVLTLNMLFGNWKKRESMYMRVREYSIQKIDGVSLDSVV